MFRLKILAVFALLAGPYFVYDSVKQQKIQERLKAEGIEVPGIITEGETSKRRKRSRKYNFTVEYQKQGEANGAKISKQFSVGSSFFNAHVSGEVISDPMVTVVYNPANPDENVLKGDETDHGLMKNLGIGATILGLLGCIYFFRPKKKTADTPPPLPQ
jgi:hypothetical protein